MMGTKQMKAIRPAIVYDNKKSSRSSWTKLYKRVKKLENQYDVELNEEHNDTGFAIFFFSQLLKLISNNPELFDEQKEVSEWDFLMKFWSSILERLFVKSGLRLKWGDTHLNNEGDESPSLKVDLKVLDDEVVQRYSQETEVAVAKFAKSSPGCAKFTSDRSKLQIEAKVVIDNHIRNDTNITSVDSLQICGLEVFITNSKLEAPGLYVGNEIYHLQIDASLSRFGEYLGLIAHLLCFM
ncbi:hypothetical protein HMPREF1544_07421, partial [Mucor circinelloides 1006PhL]